MMEMLRLATTALFLFMMKKKYELDPKSSIKIQEDLGADIIFAFDECTSPLHSYDYNKKSLKNSPLGEKMLESEKKNSQALFGIAQEGRVYQDLRKESSAVIGSLPFDGFGIGGSLGEKQMGEVIGWSLSGLPEDKPRHLWASALSRIFLSAWKRIDSFDCVIPTREARHGALYSKNGRLDIQEEFLPKIKGGGKRLQVPSLRHWHEKKRFSQNVFRKQTESSAPCHSAQYLFLQNLV